MPSRIVVQESETRVSITRFDAQQRAQHILIISSFFVLAITGLPLKYSSWGISAWWMSVWHGVDNVRTVHHYAAWVMIAACAYHLMYLAVSRPVSTDMFPKFKDLTDFIQDMKHTFRLSKQPPQFGRFSYRNKGAYWLAFPGSIVMIATGLILLYPTGATGRLPGWSVPLALIVHSDLAILSIGWILMVHVYFAHFSRHTIPFDKSIVTGKVPIERYHEEFPLEYAQIIAAEGLPAIDGHPVPVPQEAAHSEAEPKEQLQAEESAAQD